jgi:enamine deaminase RidA (YjgF/YER057c/UK114 family)
VEEPVLKPLRKLIVPLLLPLSALTIWSPTGETAISTADSEFIYIPGTLGLDPNSGALAEGVAGQFHQAMKNIGVILESEGSDFSQVASVNVFLSDTRHFQAMNEVYRTYFSTDPPTRATVGVDLPMAGALVQIAMVAVRPGVTRRVIRPEALTSPELPYSWGIQTGNTLFIAGATSRDPDTYQPVTGDITTQTRRVFGNIGAVLNAAGLDYRDLTSCTVFLDDPREFGAMNAAYREFVTDEPPARATVRAQLVNPLFGVEIQCVAHSSDERSAVIAAGAQRPQSPFSPAIKVGDRLYTAGSVGSGPNGVAKGEIESQTQQTLVNLRNTLASAQMDFTDVNAVHVFVPHISHGQVVNDLLDEMIGTRASRTTIGADLMGPDYLVEIMMFASPTAKR